MTFLLFARYGRITGRSLNTFDIVYSGYYILRMIRSVLGTPSRRFIEGGKSSFSGMDERIARRRLTQLDAATSLETFGRLNSIGLHKLSGDLRGFWSVDINGPWRLLFKFRDGDAYEVHIADTHRWRR